MELNRRKYNWIIFSLIFLISAVVIFSAVELATEQPDNKQDINISAEDDSNKDKDKKDENIEVKEDKNYLPTAPTFSNAWAAMNYAYKIMNNYSYTSTKSQTAVNDEVMGIVVRQNSAEKKYKTKEECLITSICSSNSSEGLNYSNLMYLNEADNSVIQRVVYNTDGNFLNANESKYSKADYLNKFGTDVKNSYFKLTSENATNDSFNIMGSNYVLKFTLKSNVDGVFDNMGKNILNSPAETRNFGGISATFEIKINRKTGAFVSIKTTERYYVEKNTRAIGWAGSNITVISTETFKFADININNLVKSTLGK